jgi:hypothetical protein
MVGLLMIPLATFRPLTTDELRLPPDMVAPLIVPLAVISPELSTFSLLVPLTWKLRKSAALPAPVLGSLRPM